LQSGTRHDKEIHAFIKTLAVNCPSNLPSSKDDRYTMAETATDVIVMGIPHAFCEFSLCVSEESQSDISLKALDDAMK